MLAHGVTHVLTPNEADFRRYTEITCMTPETPGGSISDASD